MVSICKANQGQGFVEEKITVPINTIKEGLADSGINGDIVPPDTTGYPDGQNWDFMYPSGFTGQQIWDNDCKIPSQTDTQTGSVTIVKALAGDEAPEGWDVEFTHTVETDGTFTLSADTSSESFTGIEVGEYTFSEDDDMGDDWTLEGISCEDIPAEQWDFDGATVTVTLENDGDSATCTFTNRYTNPDQEDNNGENGNAENGENGNGENGPDTFTLHATKLICEDESDLPRWSGSGIEIDANTATDYLAQEGVDCEVADWNFQWYPGAFPPNDLEDNAGPLSDWNTFSDTEIIEIDGLSRISVREVMLDNYLPFTGERTNADDDHEQQEGPSAEIWCNTDVLHYDNLEYIDVEAGGEYYCVAFNVDIEPKVEIVGHKLVCEDDSLLPSGSDGLLPINEMTAQNYADRVDGCELAEGWQFQWTTERVLSADTDQMAEYLDGWNTSGETGADGSVSFFINESELTNGSHVALREAFQTGYIPFSRHNEEIEGDFPTAEFYCDNDGANFDNMEWIDVEVGEIYHCVAWNVPVTYTFAGTKAEVEEDGTFVQHLADWEFALYAVGDSEELLKSTVTDEDGNYEFVIAASKIPAGLTVEDLEVREVMQSGWNEFGRTGTADWFCPLNEDMLSSNGDTDDGFSGERDGQELNDLIRKILNGSDELNGDLPPSNGEFNNENLFYCDFYNYRDEDDSDDDTPPPATQTRTTGTFQTGGAHNMPRPAGEVAGEAISVEEEETPTPEVLGEQVSVVPVGGAATGAGGTAPQPVSNNGLGFLVGTWLQARLERVASVK